MTSAPHSQDVLVIGCGVIGLSSGIRLLEHGFRVTIAAKELPPNTTSDTAAAIWYPYHAQPVVQILRWAGSTLDEFYRLSSIRSTGVSLIEMIELFPSKTESPWWKESIRRYLALQPGEFPSDYGSAFALEVPLIETPVYMHWLMNHFRELGGRIEQRTVSSISDLLSKSSLVANCSGIGARALVGDTLVYPVRGQTLVVEAPEAPRCMVDVEGPRALLYIVPRSRDCILGGTAEENDWSPEPRPETASEILRKCREIEPRLRNAKILGDIVGLRPGRSTVRLELERASPTSSIIHNYGHGGAGFTLSWGCADEVVSLAHQAIKNLS